MALKERLRAQLVRCRKFSEGLLSSFKTPEQWVHQVHPKSNHALWFAGHIASVDNFMISIMDPDKVRSQKGYQRAFGMGSQPSGNIADYPPPEEVLEYMRERREALLSILDSLSDEELNLSTLQGAPDFLPDFTTVFETAAWHEGLHAGQVTVAHRSLGNEPLSSAR